MKTLSLCILNKETKVYKSLSLYESLILGPDTPCVFLRTDASELSEIIMEGHEGTWRCLTSALTSVSMPILDYGHYAIDLNDGLNLKRKDL